MDILYFILIATISGIFAGMGMGGGTFLIPLLTLFMATPASVAQCVNLLVFVPMAIITIVIYAKQNLIDFRYWWIVSLPACIVSSVGALVSLSISGKIIKVIFGGFIAVIGVLQIAVLIIKVIKSNKKYKK